MPSSSSSSSPRSLSSRVRLYAFVVLLACLTSCAIVCFSLAVVDDVFIYAGIVCLCGDVILIGAHSVYRHCSSSSSARGSRQRRAQGSVPAGASGRGGSRPPPQRDLRALERDVEDLRGDVDRARGTDLGSGGAEEEEEEEEEEALLVRLRDDVETESGRLALWIEGRKVPERSEVQDLVERLDDIRIQLRSIRRRRRNDRIAPSLQVSTLSYNDHFLFPPPYEDSQRHLPNEQHTSSSATSFALSTYGLPAYSSSSSFSQLTPSSPPPVDDCAPPPYEEAAGAPH